MFVRFFEHLHPNRDCCPYKYKTQLFFLWISVGISNQNSEIFVRFLEHLHLSHEYNHPYKYETRLLFVWISVGIFDQNSDSVFNHGHSSQRILETSVSDLWNSCTQIVSTIIHLNINPDCISWIPMPSLIKVTRGSWHLEKLNTTCLILDISLFLC